VPTRAPGRSPVSAARQSRVEPEEEPPSGAVNLAPRWAPVASTVICLLALADSAYLTYTHYAAARIFACPTNPHSFVNCAAVTSGPYSAVLGIPVAVLGLAWSAGMLALCSPPAWRSRLWTSPRWARLGPWVGRLRLLGSVAGVGMVFWLVYVELFKKDHLCEFCTAVHVLTVALFIVVVFSTALATPAEPEEAALGTGS
jgi:uncharacterized membrane protein